MKTVLEKPHFVGLLAILACWFLGAGLCWQAHRYNLLSVSPVLMWMVTIGSGLTAVLGALPGALGELTHGGATSAPKITFGFLIGGAIRLVGTVALVALCRYQMPAEYQDAAGLLVGWYCYLTIVDVLVLTKLLSLRESVQRESNRVNEIEQEQSLPSTDNRA